MPAPKIAASYNRGINDVSIINGYVSNCASLEARYQYFICEIMLLRLFSILEITLEEIALKLACNAPYRNGSVPTILVNCKSMADAAFKMRTHKRAKRSQIRHLKFTNANNVKNCIEYVLDVNDKFFSSVNNYSSLIEEMRIVRNHIAHRNANTSKQYNKLLVQKYGGNPRLTIGAFLISTTRNNPSNLKKYLLSIPIILHDISNG